MTTAAAHPRSGPLRLRRPPWYLLLPALAVVIGVAGPIGYLLMRAAEADWQTLREVVLRGRNLWLLVNTVGLTVAVLAVVTALALPMTWLVMRTDLPARRLFTLLAVMPLAVPGYLMAYALLGLGGSSGLLAQWTGLAIDRPSGFVGALIALGLYNLPYMFLNLRVAFARMDPALEEAARSLGYRPTAVFFRVTLPQLRPALGAGTLLVALHVIGDFGVVSLMRFETFSYALYLQYIAAFDRIYAAWLALMLITLTGALLLAELRFLRGLRLEPVGITTARRRRLTYLGPWKWPAMGFLLVVGLASVGVPVTAMVAWLAQRPATIGTEWAAALGDSVTAAIPAAVATTALALPIAYLARRYPSRRSRLIEQSAFLGYAIPALAFGLALVFVKSRLFPGASQSWTISLGVLVYAYALHFLAEAVGPVRSSLYVATPRLEEAARSLGHGGLSTLWRVTLPLLRPGLIVALALVFLSVMKELPLALLLSPLGFETLATRVWSYTNEVMFAEAAPFALAIVLFSALFVGLLLMKGHGENA